MARYVAIAERDEEGWWIAHVPEVDGAMTQASRLDRVEEMARDVVATLLDVPPDSFEMEVRHQLPEPLNGRVAECRRLRAEAAAAVDRASKATNPLVADLVAADFRVREIGVLLGMTYQRAPQLAGGVPKRPQRQSGAPRRRQTISV